MVERILGIGPKVEEYALQFLRQGRKGWDIEHTRAVVYYAETIAASERLDVEVLYAAAWLHDIGYYKIFEDNDSTKYFQVMDRKKVHMVNGAKMAGEFLKTPGASSFYNPDQIQKIIHLVEVHDDFERLGETPEEIVLMEADTLGAIDLEKVMPTFGYEDGLNYIKELKRKRLPKFQTELGKQFLTELLLKFEKYFERKKP